jgi:hypothetical protein
VLGAGLWYQNIPIFFLALGSRHQEAIPTEIFGDQINGLRQQVYDLEDKIKFSHERARYTREKIKRTNAGLDAGRATFESCGEGLGYSHSSVPAFKQEAMYIVDAGTNGQRGLKRPKYEIFELDVQCNQVL